MSVNSQKTTSRSHEFIVDFQLDSVCESLRLLISQQLEPGVQTRNLLQAIRDDCVARWSGRAVDMIPAIDDLTTAADLYVIGQLVRSTNLAFLTPEEREEREAFGFHAMARSGVTP